MIPVNSLWIYYPSRELFVNSLSVTRMQFGFIIFFANSLWFHSVNFLWFHSMNCLWIHYLFHESPLMTLSTTLNDHDIHVIGIGIEFGMDSYAYHVYVAVCKIHDPKMTFFDPKMTSRCTSLESEWNLESIYMHIMCIWPCFLFLTSKWPFLTPEMTSDNLEMHIIRIRMKFGIDPYAYHVHLTILPIFDPKMTFCDL